MAVTLDQSSLPPHLFYRNHSIVIKKTAGWDADGQEMGCETPLTYIDPSVKKRANRIHRSEDKVMRVFCIG